MARRWFPGITTAQRATVTFTEREMAFDTDQDRPYVGDGATLGGIGLAKQSETNALDSRLDTAETDILTLEALTANLSGAISSAWAAVVQSASLIAGRLAGAIQRIFQADVREYQAALDGITDDATALTNAFGALSEVFVPYTAQGMAFGSGVTLSAGRSIKGATRKSILKKTAAGDFFTVTGSNVSLENLTVNNATVGNSGVFMLFDTSAGNYERIHLKNLRAASFNGGITDDNSSGSIDELYVNNVGFDAHRGQGVLLRDLAAFGFFDHFYIDYNGSADANYVAFEMSGAGGAYLHNVDALGLASTLEAAVSAQGGFKFTNMASLSLRRVDADVMGGIGVEIISCDYVALESLEATLCGDHQIVFDDVDNSYGNFLALGRSGLSYAPALKHGVYYKTGCSNVSHQGVSVQNTGQDCFADGVMNGLEVNLAPVTQRENRYEEMIVNGWFQIWQTGTSFSATGYTADGWYLTVPSGATVAATRQAFSAGDGPATGVSPDYVLQINQSVGGTGTGRIGRRVRDVKRVANCKITILSFARKTSGTVALTPYVKQNFGSGGSADVTTTGVVTKTLGASFEVTTYEVTVPSIGGKTIGAGSYIEIGLAWAESTVGVVQLSGFSARPARGVWPLAMPAKEEVLALCQQEYFKTFPQATAPAQSAGNTGAWVVTSPAAATTMNSAFKFPRPMASDTPAITFYNPGAGNAQARAVDSTEDCTNTQLKSGYISADGFVWQTDTSAGAAAGEAIAVHFTADARP